MARTREGALLTERHRLLQVRLRAATVRDLLTLWGVVRADDLRGTIAPFAKAGAVVVRAGRRASGAAAARYYVDFRRLEGVHGTTVVTPAASLEPGIEEGILRGAGISGIINARLRGLDEVTAARNGFVKVAGSAAGLVLGGGRETLLDAINSDREAQGFQRVTSGATCAFCAMVASQGIVFKDEDSAGFEAHDHCGCTAEPAFEGSEILPANAKFRQDWNDATQGLSGGEALNAFRAHLGQQ
jgi:hypothetical protein